MFEVNLLKNLLTTFEPSLFIGKFTPTGVNSTSILLSVYSTREYSNFKLEVKKPLHRMKSIEEKY